MKKIFPLFLLSALPLMGMLSACNKPIDTFEQVPMLFGTKIGLDEEVSGESQLTQISYEDFTTKVTDKENFIIISHSTTNFCSCWADFHENILAPYIKKHSLLVYFIDYQDIEGKDSYGLSVLTNHETIGIYKEGALLYQHNNSDVESEWVTKYSVFAEWMDARLAHPQAFYISRTQLDAMYAGSEAFTIYFDRATCPDCSYLDSHGLASYLKENSGCDPLYVINCDVLGIRFVQGDDGKLYGPSNRDGANSYQLAAYEQWANFKSEYGMAYSESNPAGWDTGYVPTIFHVNPDGTNKSGDVIDAAGVFYNDSADEETGAVTATYYTSERLKLDALQYLRESSVETKTLESVTVDMSLGRQERFAKYHDPILFAMLDWCIAN
ncbi:MAG: hypothetical protein K6F32_04415 [Bacilli bacterium]|nr:hypothetical protein [Bacilli bacterium]